MLVVLGHSGVSEPLFQWIYSFHMPLFFFVSGIFFKPMAHFFWGGYMRHLRIKKLYFPFVLNTFLFICFTPLLFKLHLTLTHYDSWQSWLQSILLTIRFRVGAIDLLGQYWFLPVMFFANGILLLVVRVIHRRLYQLLIFSCIFVLGYTLSDYGHFNKPYDLERAMYYSAFIYIGWISKDIVIHGFNHMEQKELASLIATSLIISILCTWLMSTQTFRALSFFVAALSGIVLFCSLAYLMRNKLTLNLFSYAGKHTLAIFTYHVLIFKLTELTLSYLGFVTMTSGWHGTYPPNPYFFIYLSTGFLIPLLFVFLKERKNDFYHQS